MKKRVLFLFACIVAAILVLYAYFIFPIPGTDSMVYIPAALLYAKGQGLANPLYYVTHITDLTHTNRFNYYVPFQAQLLGLLSHILPGVRTIFLFCALFSVTSLLLFARHLSRLLQSGTSLWIAAACSLSVTYMGMYLLPTTGRPETLTSFMALLVYLAWQRRRALPVGVIDAVVVVLCGLMLATQLLSCFFCFLVFVTFDLLETGHVLKTVVRNILRFAGILLVGALAIAWSPNGFQATVQGISAHAHHVLGRTDKSISLFLYYWVLYPFNFGFLAIFLCGAVFYVRMLAARLRTATRPQMVLVLLLQGILIVGGVKFVIYASPAVYNATQFVLPVAAFVLGQIALLKRPQFAASVVLLTFIAGSLIFARSVYLFQDYMADGKTYDNARKEVKQIAAQYPGVYISMGLWCLFDDPNDVKIFEPSLVKKGDIIIVEQANHPFPDIIKGKTTTLYDWSTKERRTFMGIPVTNRPQGYSFVVCRVTEEITHDPATQKKW